MINALIEDCSNTENQIQAHKFPTEQQNCFLRIHFHLWISKLLDKETWNTISDFWMGLQDQEITP